MAISFLRAALVTASIAGSILSFSPVAHASWFSKTFGLDHHNNPAPTPTPITIIQPVYIQPTTVSVSNPTPFPIPYSTPYTTPQPSNIQPTLPITGPTDSVIGSSLFAALLVWAGSVYILKQRARQTIKNIDVL